MLSLILAIFISANGASAAECTDFSGKYLSYNEDTDINLEFKQTGCSSAHGQYDYGYGGYINERKMIFDGVMRPLETDSSYIWLEGFRWSGSELLVENSYYSKISKTQSYSKGRIFLDGNKNLLEETVWYDKNWKEQQRSTYVYRRQ